MKLVLSLRIILPPLCAILVHAQLQLAATYPHPSPSTSHNSRAHLNKIIKHYILYTIEEFTFEWKLSGEQFWTEWCEEKGNLRDCPGSNLPLGSLTAPFTSLELSTNIQNYIYARQHYFSYGIFINDDLFYSSFWHQFITEGCFKQQQKGVRYRALWC